jgi:protein phosphatase 1G
VEKHFLEELQKNKNFTSKNFPDALKETFLKMDELLNTPAG